jgi:hypothetical protein
LETIILRSFLGLIILSTLLDIRDVIDGIILCDDLTERWPLHMGSAVISQIFYLLLGDKGIANRAHYLCTPEAH